MAAGKPVIAYGSGGVTEPVEDGVTGILVDRQEPGRFADAIRRIDDLRIDPSVLRERARRFDTPRFRSEWDAFLDRRGLIDRRALLRIGLLHRRARAHPSRSGGQADGRRVPCAGGFPSHRAPEHDTEPNGIVGGRCLRAGPLPPRSPLSLRFRLATGCENPARRIVDP